MNKNGFTLVELLVTIVVIAIIMGIVLPSALKVSEENKNKIYEEYESMMVEYALVSNHKGQRVIQLSELDELSKVKRDCSSGYVVQVSSQPLKYKAYLRCGDYETDGYDENVINDSSNIANDSVAYAVIYYDDGLLSTDNCTVTSSNPSCEITLSPALRRRGYYFSGWKSSLDNQVYEPGSTYTLTSSASMKAVWHRLLASDLQFNNTVTNFSCGDVQCALVELNKLIKNA